MKAVLLQDLAERNEAAVQDRGERAARLWGAAASLREALGSPLLPTERADHERSAANLRAAMGEEAFTACWQEGQAMTLEQVFEYGPLNAD